MSESISNLPNCKIIAELAEKNKSSNIELNYINLLDTFKSKVSIEIARINELFPEYTPHDENYHINHLFKIADELLGVDLINSMNATELFLLSASLYAHDWGMSVSKDEQDEIINNKKSGDYCLLDNEYERLVEFCNSKYINKTDISIEHWSEYVRQTHAFRSGKRVKQYFESINSGIADYLSRICEGHWLDFNVLADYTSYPTDASINRENSNIKAIAIYVRLIDLLDLGEDRTPYVLWKYVAPRNKYSKMEWDKHRCLQPITCPSYQNNRYIQICGSTDDHNVFMSLKDMERYINDQFRMSLDLMSLMNHSYHKLNISHISWQISPKGFEPIPIQFEFERSRMFQILGDDIYNNNPYVFIRELLQNSIDAIQMRIEVLNKQDLSFKPRIQVKIEDNDEYYIVEVTDNGIGMDEYIIKNYLAIAGKSYYRSDDFKINGLQMDPISRFGIGVLSCFMVADYIEIETRKEPYLKQGSELLKISIPSKENYFKLRKISGSTQIGTKFIVHIVKNKLPKSKKHETLIKLEFTQYIAKIFAFTRFPIHITEKGRETIILNPNENINAQDIIKIDYSFNYDKAILPPYINTTKEYFVEKRVNLKEDLGLENYDGCITYLVPKDNNIDIVNTGYSWPINEVDIVKFDDVEFKHLKIKINDNWRRDHYYINDDEKYYYNSCHNIYIDGIQINQITPPEISNIENTSDEDIVQYGRLMYFYDSFVNPQFYVNMSKPIGMKIDLARTSIKSDTKWDIPIWNALISYFKTNIVTKLYKEDNLKRMLSFARLYTYFHIPPSILVRKIIDPQYMSAVQISQEGKLGYWTYNNSSSVMVLPYDNQCMVMDLLTSLVVNEKKYVGHLNHWLGDDIIIGISGKFHREFNFCSLQNLHELNQEFFNTRYYLAEIKFIISSAGSDYPLVIEKLDHKKSIDEKVKYSDIYAWNVDEIDECYLDYISLILNAKYDRFPKIAKFDNPYKDKLLYAHDYINYNHDFSKKLIKLCLWISSQYYIDSKEHNHIILEDMINDLPFIKREWNSKKEIEILDLNSKIDEIFKKASELGLIISNKFEFSLDDFVENSIVPNKDSNSYIVDEEWFSNSHFIQDKEWGMPITE